MALNVSTYRYGREAEAGLAEIVERFKAPNGEHDPLVPVTIVAPTGTSVYYIRRWISDRAGGVVNVQVKPLQALFEIIGTTPLTNANRRPLPDALRNESIREVAAAGDQIFGDVAIDGAVLRTLSQRFREFDDCDETQLAEIAQLGDVPKYLVDRYHTFLKHTEQFYSQRDLADSATTALEAGSNVLHEIGSVVVYLPTDLTSAAHRFLAELAKHTDVEVLVGLTGDVEAVDRHALETWSQQGLDGAATEQVPTAQRVVQSPDAEEEVRSAIREISASLLSDDPTPLHRIAILFPDEMPYQRICAEQLDAAGLSWNGRNSETLGQSMVGRTLEGLLGLMASPTIHWANDVAPWLAAAPIRAEESAIDLAPIARWNQLARRANLQRGPDDWTTRLQQYSKTCADDLERLERIAADEDKPGRARWVSSEIKQIEKLSTFVQDLAQFANGTRPQASWGHYAERALRELNRLLGGRETFASVASGENDRQLARWDDVRELLSELSWLDDLSDGSETTVERFVSAARRGLEQTLGHHGRVGDGVHVGLISTAAGMGWDVVYIVGCAQRSLPQSRTEDPLLLDEQRARVSLTGAADHMRRQRSDYLVALLAAERRVLSYPRADMRAQRARLPGRWLLESATSLNNGKRIYASQIDRAPADVVQATPSFEYAVTDGGVPADLQEYDLRTIRLSDDPQKHYLSEEVPALGRGFEQRAERSSEVFTRWDGLIADGVSEAAERPHSAGALQDWATCPYRYFLGRVLNIQERDELSDDLQITSSDKGSLIHDILDEFYKEIGKSNAQPSPGEKWSREARELLDEVALNRLQEARAQGLTGRELLWRRDSQRILDDLQTQLDRDEVHRAAFNVKQIDSELTFGELPDSRGPVELMLDGEDHTAMQLRGMIDRVDQDVGGSGYIVIDYKTGVEFPKKRELDKDVVVGGRFLQLPTYAHAVRQINGRPPEEPVQSAYWYITERGEFKYNQILWDQANTERFTDTINLIAKHIRAGRFPANPGADHHQAIAEHCTYCSFDPVCPADRRESWDRIKFDPERPEKKQGSNPEPNPELTDYCLLTEPPELEEPD